MAQRTGAKRLLGAPAKATSARVTLALVVAALLLAGCGAGDDGQSAGATTSSASSSAPGGSKSTAATGQAAAGQGEAKPPPAAKTKTKASSGQGQKQGPRIAAPKGAVEQGPSAKEVQEATVADISLQSPAIVATPGHPGRLAPTYTCDGKDTWPALTWSGVPAGTAELVLFAMNLQPVGGKIFFDWALGAIDPALGEIEAAKLPKGAIVGTNGFGEVGYRLCPAGAGETYIFALYALPKRLGLKRGFDALAVRKAVLAQAGNVGLLPAVYERG